MTISNPYLIILYSISVYIIDKVFNKAKQDWPYDYTAQKIVPIIIQYQYEAKHAIEDYDVKPVRINKTRKVASVEFYEVVWSKMSSQIDRDISELNEYVTLEKKETFNTMFPNLVKVFMNELECKKTTKSKIETIDFFNG